MRTTDENFLDFLTQLLQLDPQKRPTAEEALRHPWLTQTEYMEVTSTVPATQQSQQVQQQQQQQQQQ